jgi:hypothetical protein
VGWWSRLANDGSCTSRRDEVRDIVHGVPGRLVQISSNHDVPMTRPADLAAVIVDLVRGRASTSAGDAG